VRPAPLPFDREDCIARIGRARQAKHRQHLSFENVGLSPAMSREEAALWLACMRGFDASKTNPKALAESLRKKTPKPVPLQTVKKDLRVSTTAFSPELGLVLSVLYSPVELATTLFLENDEFPQSDNGYRGVGQFFYSLREHAFLTMSKAEANQLRAMLKGKLAPAKFPTDLYEMPSGAFCLAPLLGLHDELRVLVESWPDDAFAGPDYADAYRVPQHFIFGLGSAELVEKHMRRLKLRVHLPEYMAAWIAHTECKALDVATDTIVGTKNKDLAATLAGVVARIDSMDAAPAMQTILKRSKAPQVGKLWLDAHAGGKAGTTSAASGARATKTASTGPALDEKALTAALARSTLDAPDPALKKLRAAANAGALEELAWRLFEDWLVMGAPSKEKWKLVAVGLLGGDASALKLGPMIRAWPGESQHQRAVLGLDCLRAIGTDTALMQLSGIALTVKFQALKERAQRCMEQIAAARGISRDQLEDRIVSDGGFDASGKRTLSFGARSFDVVLGPQGAPTLRDQSGALRDDLPKPNAKDDAAAANAAIDTWKSLKKSLKELSKIQTRRLEQAMATGRGWAPKDFQALFLKHPFMRHLGAALLWAHWDAKEKLVSTFRVAEDLTLADIKDKKVALPRDGKLGIVHPLHLTAAERTGWSAVFADYEIVSPFAQLGRPIHELSAEEKKGTDLLPRFSAKKYETRAFMGKLRRAGWVHGAAQDAGFVIDHRKTFDGLVAVVEHSGYPIGEPDWGGPLSIEHVYFVAKDDHGLDKALRLAKVGAIAVSEVLIDLE
jgi:hypothetical protein